MPIYEYTDEALTSTELFFLCRFSSAGAALDDFYNISPDFQMSGKKSRPTNDGICIIFPVWIKASLDYGNNINKSFGFTKSNVENNCAADGEGRR